MLAIKIIYKVYNESFTNDIDININLLIINHIYFIYFRKIYFRIIIIIIIFLLYLIHFLLKIIFVKKRDLEGTRTPNPLIRSQVLYPLSHETTCNFNRKLLY